MLTAAGGKALKDDIEEARVAEGISEATLRRAKDALRIIAKKDRATADGKWWWILPDASEGGLSDSQF